MLKEGAKSSLVEDTGQKLEAEYIQVSAAVLNLKLIVVIVINSLDFKA